MRKKQERIENIKGRRKRVLCLKEGGEKAEKVSIEQKHEEKKKKVMAGLQRKYIPVRSAKTLR